MPVSMKDRFSEDRHFGGHIVDHEGILSKLDFNTEFSFNEVHLAKGSLSQLFGFMSGHIILCRIVATNSDGLPAYRAKLLFELCIEAFGRIKALAPRIVFSLLFFVLHCEASMATMQFSISLSRSGYFEATTLTPQLNE